MESALPGGRESPLVHAQPGPWPSRPYRRSRLRRLPDSTAHAACRQRQHLIAPDIVDSDSDFTVDAVRGADVVVAALDPLVKTRPNPRTPP